MKNQNTLKLVLAGLLTALGVLLPSIFHTVGMSGSIFLPMHIPVLLCGLICGHKLGGLSGFLVPLLSSTLTGMPPLYPVAIYMMCELIAYGVIAGILSKKYNTIITLIVAMLGGRIVLAIAQITLLGMGGKGFVIGAFLTSAFVTALPGIIIQLVMIPIIILAIKKSNIIKEIG